MSSSTLDPCSLFSMYMQVTGVPSLAPVPTNDSKLYGKKLGVVNGSSWITLWANYFGRKYLPGVKIINAGNEAVQLNFMDAHMKGEPCPPQKNIDLFVRYAVDLVELAQVDAVLISCSTMNRATGAVRAALAPYGVPVVSIDEAMMETAVMTGGKTLVVATHGPTVKSTQKLLEETGEKLGRPISFCGATIEACFELLGRGDIGGHNKLIAEAIVDCCSRAKISSVVLAQLSMTVFLLTYPDPLLEFGIPVLTSGEMGFRKIAQVLG